MVEASVRGRGQENQEELPAKDMVPDLLILSSPRSGRRMRPRVSVASFLPAELQE